MRRRSREAATGSVISGSVAAHASAIAGSSRNCARTVGAVRHAAKATTIALAATVAQTATSAAARITRALAATATLGRAGRRARTRRTDND